MRTISTRGVCLKHGHDAIVLGAWGCGVFKNDPAEIARLFKEALYGRFRNQYQLVDFAILDNTDDQRYLLPFENAFAGSR